MQNFFIKIWQGIKSKLFGQRTQHPTVINKYAVIDKTDLLVKRESKKAIQRQVDIDVIIKSANQIKLTNRQEQRKSQLKMKRQDQQQFQAQNRVSQQPMEEIKSAQQRRHCKPSFYKLSLEEEQTSEQSPVEKMISLQMQLDQWEREMDQHYNKFKSLQKEDEQRKKHFWKHVYQRSSLDQQQLFYPQLSSKQSQQDDQDIGFTDLKLLQKSYEQDIQATLEFKYYKQLIDYPHIDFSAYKNIRNLWFMGKTNPNQIIKSPTLNFLPKLSTRSFRTLSHGNWLNDEIINGYLEMVDNKAVQLGLNFRVLNSFFAQTTFSKSSDVIQRVLKRKNITLENNIVIAINNGNHWLFASIIQGNVIIYDSIKKNDIHYMESASTKTILEKIMKFANSFYYRSSNLTVDESYPQQNNSSDCGMFLLCGIKDIVRGYKEWSFDQSDINYKRILVSKELLDEQLVGFE